MDMSSVRGATILEQEFNLASIFNSIEAFDWQKIETQRWAVTESGEIGGYGPIEADVLFAFLLAKRPRKVVQVGCGVSTSIILRAAKYGNFLTELVCVDPYPSDYLKNLAKTGDIVLASERAECVNFELFSGLDPGDLLFIDSTHCVRPGGDVNRLILCVLPKLNDGVFVHFHDIYFPYDYQRGILADELFFQSESTLLHAYLSNNTKYRILFSLSQIHYGSPNLLRSYLPHYSPQLNADGLAASECGHFPSSTYLVSGLPR